MKILNGEALGKKIRSLSDGISKRLWIAVPYIGNPKSIRCILGKNWYENPSVSIRLLTDISDSSNVNSQTLKLFYDRGKIRSLIGLHAKIYIIDDHCLITSANLTPTAFTKRHEIGILYDLNDDRSILKIFEEWWNIAKQISHFSNSEIPKKSKESTDDLSVDMPILYKLPPDPGSFVSNITKRFLDYDRRVEIYDDFAQKYQSVQRLWKDKPLYLEVDGLFNYLYHHAPGIPSKEYSKKNPRKLSDKEQILEIKKWAKNYMTWNDKGRLTKGEDDIEWRIRSSKKLRKLLAKNKIMDLDEEQLKDVFKNLNSMNSWPINRTKIISRNSASDIKKALNYLLNNDNQLADRMNFCNNLNNIGPSSIYELLGFTNPEKYPLINKNSSSGLRFFGYDIIAY